MTRGKVRGVQKVAALLLLLGSEASSRILKQYFNEEEIERISYEISQISQVTEAQRKEVVDEFLELAQAQKYMLSGGIKYARELLEKTVGQHRAREILNRLMEINKKLPFTMLQKMDPIRLASIIADEHPQAIALILGFLDPSQSSVILSNLPDDQKAEVAKRIALLEQTTPEVVDEVEKILERKVASVYNTDYRSAGGINVLVDILNRVDRSTEKNILKELENQDGNLVEEIRQRLFVFEDIVNLDDVSIRRVLREVDQKDLALALKVANDGVMQKIINNLSQRVQEMLKEEIEFMGPVRLREVEETQQKIVRVIRKLEEAGEIVISRGGDQDAIIV